MNRIVISLMFFLSMGRGIFSFLMCTLFALYLVNSSSEGKGHFIQLATSSLLFPVQSSINWVNKLKSVDAENSELLEENAQLRLRIDSYKQSEMENQRLRGYLKFPRKFIDPVMVAQVVSRDPGRLQSSCMINRGEDAEVQTNMPVFTPSGLVGKISKVMHNHSFVQFLNDPASKVSVVENTTRTIGILESRNGIDLEAEFPEHTEVEIGDTLVTSGFGGVFPKGIQVGVVSEWVESDIEVLKKAKVRPFQQHQYLEEMFVLKSRPKWKVYLKHD